MDVLEEGGLIDVCGGEVVGVDVAFTHDSPLTRAVVCQVRENHTDLLESTE